MDQGNGSHSKVRFARVRDVLSEEGTRPEGASEGLSTRSGRLEECGPLQRHAATQEDGPRSHQPPGQWGYRSTSDDGGNFQPYRNQGRNRLESHPPDIS